MGSSSLSGPAPGRRIGRRRPASAPAGGNPRPRDVGPDSCPACPQPIAGEAETALRPGPGFRQMPAHRRARRQPNAARPRRGPKGRHGPERRVGARPDGAGEAPALRGSRYSPWGSRARGPKTPALPAGAAAAAAITHTHTHTTPANKRANPWALGPPPPPRAIMRTRPPPRAGVGLTSASIRRRRAAPASGLEFKQSRRPPVACGASARAAEARLVGGGRDQRLATRARGGACPVQPVHPAEQGTRRAGPDQLPAARRDAGAALVAPFQAPARMSPRRRARARRRRRRRRSKTLRCRSREPPADTRGPAGAGAQAHGGCRIQPPRPSESPAGSACNPDGGRPGVSGTALGRREGRGAPGRDGPAPPARFPEGRAGASASLPAPASLIAIITRNSIPPPLPPPPRPPAPARSPGYPLRPRYPRRRGPRLGGKVRRGGGKGLHLGVQAVL